MTVMAAALWIFTILFLAFIVVDIGMFVSLGRQGDERRKMIVEKSSAQTFAVFAVYTLFCVLEGLYRSLFPRATSQADMLACPFGDCRESQKPCRLLRGF